MRRYIEGITQAASAQGFAIDLLRLGSPGLETVADVGRVLRARGIRGLVVMPVFGEVALEALPFDMLAVSTIDLSLRSPPMSRATPDYF